MMSNPSEGIVSFFVEKAKSLIRLTSWGFQHVF